jgi:ferritin
MKPPLSILDPRFVYRNSASTDVGATFARVRERLRAQADHEQFIADLVNRELELAQVIVAHVNARTRQLLP